MQSGIGRLVLLLILSLGVLSAHAGLYRYVDEDGQVHYSDQKPRTSNFKSLKVKLGAPARTTEMAKKKSTTGVVIYTSSTCNYYKQAKTWMVKNGVSFTERNISTNRSAMNEYSKLSARGVPLILVGKNRLNGFNPQRLQALLDKR